MSEKKPRVSKVHQEDDHKKLYSSYDDLEDEISLAEIVQKFRSFVRQVWQQQRYIWFAWCITLPIGLLIALGSREEYTASTKILPYKSSPVLGGGLSSLAGLAGIRLPSGASDQLISVDLYPELVNTLDFRVALAETPLRFSDRNEEISFVRYFSEEMQPVLFEQVKKYTIGLPGLLRSGMTDAQTPKSQAIVSELGGIKQYDKEYIKLMDAMGERLQVRANQTQRVTSSLTIEATLPDPVAAADLVQKASAKLMEAVIDYESRKVGEEIRFLEEQYAESKRRFESSQRSLALFTDRNRGTLSAVAQIENQRLQSELTLASEIYRTFSTQLEQARIKQNQDTPIFTVLESVTIPNERSSPKKTMIVFLSVVMGALIGTIYLGLKILAAKIKEEAV